MNTKVYEVGPIESGVPISQRMGQVLTPDQRRVLELKGGDSFVLHAIPIVEDDDITARWRCQSASHIAARLPSWARGRRIRLAYRMVGKDSSGSGGLV